ncbi:MAG: peptidoglycan editing factor PgeF [Rhodocyclaceae bacterium]|jgi:YfiH family protein|nr:peptidoglycan editing factor PgeF [Rhodocyclaceae bacterium]MCE2981306.1 peptidoglycan editing factor PgeF [Betaproteobacteria bacterium]MCA3076178.1 peptidoglycan editing factor PgeF [Rhodocyclaceae bacterium]MCA3089365.1 peptidoglycan editing factor PgeF [Rhodocyclaceae bacterium]MCA3092926.1 peptidoglycan editing factor PgeF [Rhodocyclaceae bacterium]
MTATGSIAAADLLVPDWPAPPGVHALCTTRSGGVSTGPYRSLNLGTRTGDDPAAVAENRRRLDALLPGPARWLQQVHGSQAIAAHSIEAPPQADASFTDRGSTVCTVMIADCMPVLLCSEDGLRVGAVHCGWRGLAGGAIENTLAAMGVDGQRIIAWLGPAIGPAAFEVGADVRDAFLAADPSDAAAFVPSPTLPGKWHADLFALGRRRLARAGVERVHGGGLCTVSDPDRFFSYRRDKVTGRMAALVWRDA